MAGPLLRAQLLLAEAATQRTHPPYMGNICAHMLVILCVLTQTVRKKQHDEGRNHVLLDAATCDRERSRKRAAMRLSIARFGVLQ